MQITPSERSLEIKDRVVDFMDRHVCPMNKHYHEVATSDRRNDADRACRAKTIVHECTCSAGYEVGSCVFLGEFK